MKSENSTCLIIRSKQVLRIWRLINGAWVSCTIEQKANKVIALTWNSRAATLCWGSPVLVLAGSAAFGDVFLLFRICWSFTFFPLWFSSSFLFSFLSLLIHTKPTWSFQPYFEWTLEVPDRDSKEREKEREREREREREKETESVGVFHELSVNKVKF